MSVFIADINEDDVPNMRKTRKKYNTKYNIKYKEEYPWALPSSKGDLYAFCHLCYVDISIKSVGAKGLRDHEATCRHSQKAHEMAGRSQPSTTVAPIVSQHQGYFDETQTHGNAIPNVVISSNIPTSFTVDMSNSCSAPLRSFAPAHNGKMPHQHPQMSTMMGHSLLATSDTTNMTSASYTPVLEVEENDMQTACRSPQTPQTPNTPSSPLSQDHFTQKFDQVSSTGLQNMNPQISEHLHPSTMQETIHCNAEPDHQSNTMICTTFQQETPVSEVPTNDGNPKAPSHDARSNSPSVEDLTCSICSRIFPDWKELKKDLMEHIKDANEKKSESQCQKASEEEPKRRLRRQIKPKRSCISPIAESVRKPRRGRPPGRKKKVEHRVPNPSSSHSSCDFENTSENKLENNFSFAKSEESLESSSIPPMPAIRPKKRGRPPKNSSNTAKTNTIRTDEGNSLIASNGLPPVSDEIACSDNVMDMCQQQVPEDMESNRNVKIPQTRRSGQLQCRVCRSIFYLRQDLKEHYQKEHNNGRPYWCQICDKFFTTKNNLEVHSKHKHIQGPNPCVCTVCCKLLSSRTNLKIHMMIHKGERPFMCPVCNKSFSRKANMEMHMVYHTGERRFTCEICGQSFFAINALKRHKKLHSGEREFQCDICDATYVTGTDLRRHRLKHEDVKPFPCSICEKQFTRSHDLKVHMRYHNKEIRFTCNVCGKQFVESGNYRRHMRRHTGERPYTCEVCEQSFSQVHHYKVHVRTNHPDQAETITDWSSSGHGRPSIHRNPPLNSLNQRSLPIKRPQKLSPDNTTNNNNNNQNNANPPSSILRQQLCAPTATVTTTMNNTIPEHIHNIHTVHIHNPNNVSVHNHSGTTTIANITPISSAVGNMTEIHHPHNSTGTPPVAHVPMMASHHSQVPQGTVTHPPTGGFIQYNSYIYNTGVLSPYPPLFDMCPQ